MATHRLLCSVYWTDGGAPSKTIFEGVPVLNDGTRIRGPIHVSYNFVLNTTRRGFISSHQTVTTDGTKESRTNVSSFNKGFN